MLFCQIIYIIIHTNNDLYQIHKNYFRRLMMMLTIDMNPVLPIFKYILCFVVQNTYNLSSNLVSNMYQYNFSQFRYLDLNYLYWFCLSIFICNISIRYDIFVTKYSC